MRKLRYVLFVILFFSLAVSLAVTIMPEYEVFAQDSGYWKLDSVSEGLFVTANHNTFGTVFVEEKHEIHKGRGSFSTTIDDYGTHVTINSSHSFSIPDSFAPGEAVDISLSCSDSTKENSYAVSMQHYTCVKMTGNDQGGWVYAYSPGETGKVQSDSATVQLTAPQPSKDNCVVTFTISSAKASGDMEIYYYYTFVSNKPAAPTTTEKVQSVCVFSDLAGQVEILIPSPDDPDEENWQFAKIDTPIPADAKIRTGLDSSAVLSFPDMSTFVMKPSTTIIIPSPVKKQSIIKLAAGNIWVNVKKMLKDGTMDVEMSQAVAGIKGTIFVCEENNGTSTLKVIEGKVEFNEKSGSGTVMVSGGEYISAGEEPEVLSNFDVNAEYQSWLAYSPDLQISNTDNNPTVEGLNKKGSNLFVKILLGLLVAGLLTGIIFIAMKISKGFKSHMNDSARR